MKKFPAFDLCGRCREYYDQRRRNFGWTRERNGGWSSFRVMIDLKDNGMRDVNKYQSMWDAANDTTAIYAETNKDYVNTLQRRFFRPPFIQPVRCKKVKIEGVKIINSPFGRSIRNFATM